MTQNAPGQLGHPVVDIGYSSVLDAMATAHPQNLTHATVTGSAGTKATLKAGCTYWVIVQPSAADLTTPTAVYASFGGAATTSSLMLTSALGIVAVRPVTDTALSLLRVGSADVTVDIVGLSAAATTAS
jgi:hypothetical protein